MAALQFPINLDLMIFMQVTLFLLQLIAMSAVAVSIHRVILFGDTKPGVWFNFPFGATEVRFLAMGLLFALMTICVICADRRAGAVPRERRRRHRLLQGLAGEGHPSLIRNGGFFVLIGAYLAGWLTVLFFLVRLSVWPPSVVASGRLSPGEPWRLTRGNFWSLIGLFILVGVTLYALFIPFGIAAAVFMFTQMRDLQAQSADLPPEKVFEMVRPMLPFLAAFYFIMIVFVTGVTVAVLSYAYKALKGVDAKASMAEG